MDLYGFLEWLASPKVTGIVCIYLCTPLAWAAFGSSAILRENRLPALSVAVAVTMFSVVFYSNDLPVPVFDFNLTRVLTRIPFDVMVVTVSLNWMRGYRSRLLLRFRRSKPPGS